MKVKYIFGLVLLFLCMELPFSNLAAKPHAPNLNKNIDHQSWDALLKKHVDDHGNVDYKNFKNDLDKLSGYLDYLATSPPTDKWSKKEQLAYYINLYNAATVKLILDNYPLKSIKDLSGPWDKKIVTIGDEAFSLGHIEHAVLRKMGEPRIHFAINCASYSCPKLLNEAFTVNKLDAQLDKAAKDFINDPTKNRISDDGVQLSQIFKWYKKDFTEKGSLRDYINQYSSTLIPAGSKIKYLDYNWALNEAR